MAYAGAAERLAFAKFHGLGNDFLIVDLRGQARLEEALDKLRAQATAICHRGEGVGADGILVVTPSQDASCLAQMVIINADGSRPEMCGNGLRCVAHYLRPSLDSFRVLTDRGPLQCELDLISPSQAMVQVAMGAAEYGEKVRPKAAPDRVFDSVSMGNPHAICWVGSDEDPQALAQTLGPKIELDPAYPHRSNVEFVQDTGDELVTWVWERGCGITRACGTGACATAAAAVRQGLRPANSTIAVRLPGGVLEILVPQDPQASILMKGPSRWVFDGFLG